MNFDLKEAIEVLERTPGTLEHLLDGLSDGWHTCNEGEATWNVSEVMDHLILGEMNNWMPRVEEILQRGPSRAFPPFERDPHLSPWFGSSVDQKLREFRAARAINLRTLKERIQPQLHLEWTGTHPEFGIVKLRELLSTWVVHDLTHIVQIVRVMAERYRADVGPWRAYLGILNRC